MSQTAQQEKLRVTTKTEEEGQAGNITIPELVIRPLTKDDSLTEDGEKSLLKAKIKISK